MVQGIWDTWLPDLQHTLISISHYPGSGLPACILDLHSAQARPNKGTVDVTDHTNMLSDPRPACGWGCVCCSWFHLDNWGRGEICYGRFKSFLHKWQIVYVRYCCVLKITLIINVSVCLGENI